MWTRLFPVRAAAILMLLVATFISNLSAQQSVVASNAETTQLMLQRIEQLEAELRGLRSLESEVRELRAEVQSLKAGQPAAVAPGGPSDTQGEPSDTAGTAPAQQEQAAMSMQSA